MTPWWQLEVLADAALAVVTLAVAMRIFAPLVWRRELGGQWLATAVAAFFACSAVGYALLAVRLLVLAVGPAPVGDPVVLSTWWTSAWHALTALVALGYLLLRRSSVGLSGSVPPRDLAEQQRVADLQARSAEHVARAEAQRNFYAALVASINRNSHSLIHVKDPQGRYLLLNEAFQRAFGVTEEELLGQADEVLDPVMAPIWRANDRRARRGAVRVQEYTHRQGSRQVFESAKFPVVGSDGTLFGTCGIALDVTEMTSANSALSQARDEAVAATEATSSFLANMSHEIRTPMNAVIGMTDLLLDTPLDEQQHECLQTVRYSGDTLLAVVNDVLEFSLIESGSLLLARDPFDLREELESCLDLVAAVATAKGLDVLCYVEDSCHGTLVGDADRIRQIVITLLANAVKFTDQGEVLLTATVHPGVDGRLELTLAVTDTGAGFSTEDVARLFSWSQVDNAVTRLHGGQGLGLAISQRLAQAMGGDVGVTSTPGEGSTFTVSLLVDAEPAEQVRPQPIEPALQGRSVLLVDDNATALRILDLQLQNVEMACTPALSGREALDLVRSGCRYDVALVDLDMPGMGGLELVAALRRHPATAALPIVLLSGMGVRPDALDDDRVEVLAKPIRTAQLWETVRRAVTTAKAGQDAGSGQADAGSSPTGGLAVGKVPEGGVPAGGHAEVVPDAASTAPEWSTGLRVLVAEDNLVNQRVAQLMLTRLGHQVDIVDNGRAAVDAVTAVPYDVVLMDVQMPEMDGLEATRLIRSQLRAEQQPHIIAMTANTLVEDRNACAAAGMESYLSKPVRVQTLASMLLRVSATIRRPSGQGVPHADPAAGSVASHAAVDQEALLRLREQLDDHDGLKLRELIDSYLDDAAHLIARLSDAVPAEDSATVRAVTHTWSSTSALLGAESLADLLRHARELADSPDELTVLMEQIEREYAGVVESLREVSAAD